MINLEKTSGLPIEVTKDYHLKFNPPLKEHKLSITRKFSEMVPVLMDKTAQPTPSREDMYYVYRNVAFEKDREIIEQNHLTYDITVVPPGRIGREFNKTLGHYHANIPGKEISHPELYEILAGQGLFVLQKTDPEFKNIITVLILEAKAGEKIVYPPNYGHIMVNIGTEPLVTANWLCTDYKPLYEPVKDKKGMGYYVLANEKGEYELEANPNYDSLPKPRIIDNRYMKYFPIMEHAPMYVSAMIHPKNLEFLAKPEKYAVELSSITS